MKRTILVVAVLVMISATMGGGGRKLRVTDRDDPGGREPFAVEVIDARNVLEASKRKALVVVVSVRLPASASMAVRGTLSLRYDGQAMSGAGGVRLVPGDEDVLLFRCPVDDQHGAGRLSNLEAVASGISFSKP